MAVVGWVVALVLATALGLAVLALVALRRRLTGEQQKVAQLEEDLSAALRPRHSGSATERALRRVVRTMDRVREGGITGLLESSLDDLTQWASDEQSEISSMATADGYVTLLFSDIENSTELNSKLGDNAWVKLLAAHDQAVRGQVDKYRGQVVKTAGDGYMIAFRDAEAACRAAIGVQREHRRSLDPRGRRGNHTLKVRIGIHYGQVITRDGDYFGRNVSTAARVGDLAAGGDILVTRAIAEGLDEDADLDLEEFGTYELKGLDGEHDVWRIAI